MRKHPPRTPLAPLTQVTPQQTIAAAEAALDRGDFKEAVGSFRALLCNPPDDTPATRVALLRGLAAATARSARFEEALSTLDEWDDLCHTCGLDRFLPLKFRGNCLAAMDLFQPALEAYREAWSLVRESDRHHDAGAILNNIGTVYQRLNDHEAAREHYGMALRHYEKAESPEGCRVALCNVASIASIRGDLTTAREGFRTYLEESKQAGRQMDEALGHLGLAEVEAKAGDWATAETHFSAARTIFGQTGQRDWHLQTFLRQLHWQLESPTLTPPSPEHLHQLEAILTECEENNWLEYANNALSLKARIYRLQGNSAAACEVLDELLERQKNLFERNNAAQLRSLGILHRTEAAVAEAAAERKQNEALQDHLRETEKERRRAEKADELKTRVLRIVSHELRNPIGAIATCLELVTDVPDSEDAGSLLNVARHASNDALKILGQLLDAAEMESDTIRLDRVALNLNDVLAAATTRFQTIATRKNQTFDFAHPAKPVTVFADETRLGMIVDNLLSNALKYSPPGTTIRTGVEIHPEGPALYVTDQGPGLTREDHARLFQLFGRIDRARPTGNEKAVGLGLYIARHLAHLHGGDILAHSDGPGTGSTFRLYLPPFEESPAP